MNTKYYTRGRYVMDDKHQDRAHAFCNEEAEFIKTACNAHDQLTADNAALRADLSDARSNWESGAEELRQADLVREQLVEALKIGRDVMALVGLQDHLIDYDAVSKGRKIVADAITAASHPTKVSDDDKRDPLVDACFTSYELEQQRVIKSLQTKLIGMQKRVHQLQTGAVEAAESTKVVFGAAGNHVAEAVDYMIAQMAAGVTP